MNGTYINDVRIKGSQILREGDKIAFGHLRGAIIDPGEYAPQKETEFLFVVSIFISFQPWNMIGKIVFSSKCSINLGSLLTVYILFFIFLFIFFDICEKDFVQLQQILYNRNSTYQLTSNYYSR